MAVFAYRALDSRGKQTNGLIDAENIRAARQKLKAQGIFPTSVIESDGKRKSIFTSIGLFHNYEKKVSTAQLSIVTRQFATLVGAGMPLVEALKALGEQIDHQSLKSIVATVAERVNEGSTLAAALKEHPRVFPRLYTNMVASGEASGSLETVLSRLAELLESQTVLKRKVSSALAYPILMLTLCVIVVLILLAYVVPQITAIFQDRNAVLPLPTRIVISSSDFIREYYWFIGIFGLLLITILKVHLKTDIGRRRFDKLILRLPVIGSLALKVATARFARNLGTMLNSGIELLGALAIVKNIVGNVILEDAVESSAIGVREGGNLASELEKTKLFPRLLIHMIAIGEKTGQLESLLLRAANSYDSEIQAIISSFTSILEPLLILLLAVIVGGILSAVMLPMLEMTSLSGL